MKTVWFKGCGWIHRPVSFQGGALVVVAMAFCGLGFRAVDRHAHSASDTLFGIYPFFAGTFLLLDWVARRTSDDSR